MHRRSSRRWIPVALVALATGLTLAATGSAEGWPQFRGHHRNGISTETGLLSEWPDGGPKELWRQPIGEGFAAITVVGDRLYTLYAEGEGEEAREIAAAFSTGGKEVWRFDLGQKLNTDFGNGPRSTPTVDGKTVFVLGSRGDFAALDRATGERIWAVPLTETFGSAVPRWGFSSSALVEGDLVLIEVGGKEGKSFAALDKATGKTLWTTGDGDGSGPGYSSPMVIDVGDQRRFVYVVENQIRAIDTRGQEIWSHPWEPLESHGMPIYLPPDRYFVSGIGGDDEGAFVFRVAENGGEPKVETVWKSRVMKNHFSSSLLHDGHIYGFDNSTLRCITAEAGETTWAKRGLGKGSLILADGHLLVLSDRGKLLLLEATHESYNEKGSVQALDGRCWTAPTLSDGKLYLRSHSEMVSYDLKG